MIGVGMIKVLLIILGPLVIGILSESSSTYIVLSFVADAGYYFMPIYAAVSAADVFKVDRFLAALIGAMLIAPQFVDLVAQDVNLTVFGLPIASTNYGSQVIPSIIAVWLMSYVCTLLKKMLPESLVSFAFPPLVILLMVPITFSLIGPLGVLLSDLLVDLILFLKDLGPLGNGILCALIPFITIAGLSGANLSAMLILAATGVDPILFFSNVLYNNILGFVTLALYIRDRKSETLAVSITAALAGSSEPALFGIVMKDYKALFSLSFSCFLAGLYSGIMKVKSFAMASFGIFGIITTIGKGSSIVHAAIALLIGCISGFFLTLITHRK